MSNSNVLYLESVNPVPVISKMPALHKEQPLPAQMIKELELSFEATVNCEVRQYKRELMDFIDVEIEKLTEGQ
ncbi:MAG: hypothetical protein MJK10_19205 [Pseudomonadales bacterium]|nr:hypothetical protein [Pseudomonadales bacterium]NRA15262.1 hypothetical protein [Oceanospirillaceae bacterium]